MADNFIEAVENAILAELLALKDAGTLRSVDVFDVTTQRDLEEAFRRTLNQSPAAFLSPPVINLIQNDQPVDRFQINFVCGVGVAGRRTIHDRRVETGGIYDIWQAVFQRLANLRIQLPGYTQGHESNRLKVSSSQFPGGEKTTHVIMNLTLETRVELLSRDPR